jgi:hypothetical protein
LAHGFQWSNRPDVESESSPEVLGETLAQHGHPAYFCELLSDPLGAHAVKAIAKRYFCGRAAPHDDGQRRAQFRETLVAYPSGRDGSGLGRRTVPALLRIALRTLAAG